MSLAVQILIAFLLSNANPTKEKARQYLKDKLSGWKEALALAVFDLAWEAALKAVGAKIGSIAPHAGDEVAAAAVLADKHLVS